MKRFLLTGLLLLCSHSYAIVLCDTTAKSFQSFLPGIYTVIINVDKNCPADGYAVVRLVSGREYPWEIVSRNNPYIERGVPWYWRGQSLTDEGKVNRFTIPGLRPPWLRR